MNLVGLKELSELLEVPYEKLKVWKSRGRLPEPFQTISGTPVWDWDEVEDEFRAIPQNENSGRPKRPRISLAGGLIDIDVKKMIQILKMLLSKSVCLASRSLILKRMAMKAMKVEKKYL